jgi:hypothetical protein
MNNMNKFSLTENQLLELKYFIHKRGIKESDVVNEILDHFACKVEELMNKDVYLYFDKAMQLAHQSFGKTGFRPLVASYEKHIEKTMWSTFKNELKNVLTSPKIIFLIAYGLCLYPLLQYGAKHYTNRHWLFSFELLGLISIVLLASIGNVLIFFKIRKKIGSFSLQNSNLHYWQKQVLSIPSLPFVALIIGLSFGDKSVNPNIYITFLACFSILSLIRILAQHKTYLEMEAKFGSA